MMMSMLHAGGLEVMADGIREADIDNPKGYFEDERVKDLETMSDKSWIQMKEEKSSRSFHFF